ncbi:MAG: hypothetical protein KGZ79_06005 [Dethiobacter sp.]|jgi:hypothetical protein|nr:hypothetical protein [Dethiobacter sp.]
MHHLTQRELLYLEDFLKNEQLNYKSMTFFAEQCTDQSIKQLCQDAAQTAKQNYQTMVKHINTGTLQ